MAPGQVYEALMSKDWSDAHSAAFADKSHPLAWAFLASSLDAHSDERVCDVWARALSLPPQWWMPPHVAQLPDRSEEEQNEVLCGTVFIQVWDTVNANPNLRRHAFVGQRLPEGLAQRLPEGMPPALFRILLRLVAVRAGSAPSLPPYSP